MFSFFAILLFFYIIFDMFVTNNQHFTLNNNLYVIYLSSKVETLLTPVMVMLLNLVQTSTSPQAVTSKAYYLFNKYNFFNQYKFNFVYIYLNKFL